jgi:hypothetical protein
MEELCTTYGIPDVQRAQCAANFTESEVRTVIERELEDARASCTHIHWAQFTDSMAAFDRE